MIIDKDNIKKILLMILVMVVLLILDTSFIPFLSFYSEYGSLLFTFAIAYSIIRGKKEAIFMGIASGFFQDIFFYNGLGVNLICNLITCYLAAIIGEKIYRTKKVIPVFSIILLTIIKVFVCYIVLKISGIYININTSLISSIYNLFIMFLGYDLVLKLYDTEESKNSWRF